MHLTLTSPVQSGGRFFTRSNVRGYCFGFNVPIAIGKMKDDEVYGEGNAYAFEYRIHDARLGRFLSVDPLAPEYPWNSTYAFAENKVIQFIDLEGLEIMAPKYILNNANPEPVMKLPTKQEVQAPRIPQATISQGGVGGTRQYKFFEANLNNAAPMIPGMEIAGKYMRGEPISTLDIGLEVAGVFPGGFFFRGAFKYGGLIVKQTFKYSDEAVDLVATTFRKVDDAGVAKKEIFTITKTGSFKDAKAIANSITNMGDDAVDYVSSTGKGKNPFYGKVVGKQSSNGDYWRVDWSEADGAHINWSANGQKGSIPFTGDLEQAKRIIDNGGL